ncbi:hypothetical protein [Stenotrophomonas maltophilia]|uniref:hypothetical protein n=1 Tax=Stenotrophomonas maltophilia TaxID=40324 RepID=UPI002894C1A9|nr:hypothetical protein [Stenotrophomonas maltophilia]MDT3487949.1 hypothetical protein [Stenotrophomonas maltophilia]
MYHKALPAALILPFPESDAGTVADRQAPRLAVLALPELCVFPHTGNNVRFMDEIRGWKMRTTTWDARPAEPGR